jgi:hypothetical protein
MKKLVLYFLLLMVVPATAQSGLFGKRSHHDPSTPAREYHPRPMIKPGHHNPHAPRLEEIGMNRRDYKEAVRIINNENFDERRLATAERIIASNPMSTRQIANICKLFNFESNRLEFAKYAYHRCVDPNNYFMIDEVFTFDSSKKELYNFIRNR